MWSTNMAQKCPDMIDVFVSECTKLKIEIFPFVEIDRMLEVYDKKYHIKKQVTL